MQQENCADFLKNRVILLKVCILPGTAQYESTVVLTERRLLQQKRTHRIDIVLSAASVRLLEPLKMVTGNKTSP